MKYRNFFSYLIFFSLVGCAYLDKPVSVIENIFNNDEETIDSVKNVSSQVLWSTDIGKARSYRTTVLQPAYNDGNIYTIDSNGLIHSINSSDGDENWSYSLNLDVTSGISFHNGYLFFGTFDGKIYGYDIDRLKLSNNFFDDLNVINLLNKKTLDPDMMIELNSEVSAPITGMDEKIFVRLSDGDTLAINYKTSSVIWQYHGKNVTLNIKGSGSISTSFNNIFVARDDGTLISLSHDSGKLNWLTSISPRSGRNELESLRDVEMTPLLDNGIVFVGSYQGSLIAVDSLTGTLIWSTPMSVRSNLDIDEYNIYVATEDGSIFALDKYTGDIVWKSTVDSKLFLTQSLVYENYVVTLSASGHIVIVDRNTGDLLSLQELISPINYQSRILIIDKILYIVTKNGRLNSIQIN
jgi:outer membrane protein assembly factor BamB